MSTIGITAEELSKALGLCATEGFYRKTGIDYMRLMAFPGTYFDWTGYLLLTEEKHEDYIRSGHLILVDRPNPRYGNQPDHRQHKKIRIPSGIFSIHGYVKYPDGKTAEEILIDYNLGQLGL